MKYIIIYCVLILAACKVQSPAISYENAVKASMYPQESKVDDNLINITHQNRSLFRYPKDTNYVLFVTWKTKNYYPDSGKYNTGNYDIWVTAAPELLDRINAAKTKNKSDRLKQMLGLPPASQYNYFIEFWVKPEDLFRPCPDQEVTDKKCNVCFTHQDSLNAAYLAWFNTTRIERYYPCELYSKYPWTELGYTYDWNPKNKGHKGLSEFVIRRNSNIYVNKVYTTEEYFAKKY